MWVYTPKNLSTCIQTLFIHLLLSFPLLGTCSTKKVRSTSIGGSITPESIKKTLQTSTTNDQSPTETMSMIITMSYHLHVHVMYIYIYIVAVGREWG